MTKREYWYFWWRRQLKVKEQTRRYIDSLPDTFIEIVEAVAPQLLSKERKAEIGQEMRSSVVLPEDDYVNPLCGLKPGLHKLPNCEGGYMLVPDPRKLADGIPPLEGFKGGYE